MILDKPGFFGKVATAIGAAGGNIGDIKLVGYGSSTIPGRHDLHRQRRQLHEVLESWER